MTLDHYSLLITVGVCAVAVATVGAAIAALISERARALLFSFSYERYLMKIGAIAVLAIGGALIYELVYLTPVCPLCWWQRVFLVPIPLVIGVGLYRRGRDAHVVVGILSALALMIASYHYYFHFQAYVLGNLLSVPCGGGGLFPACADSPVLTFGFVTIPFMGILTFGSLLIMCVFAEVVNRRAGARSASAV